MMSLEIAQSLIDTPVESLVDMEDETDIQIIRCIATDHGTLVEFDSRLISVPLSFFEIARRISTEKSIGLKYFTRVIKIPQNRNSPYKRYNVKFSY